MTHAVNEVPLTLDEPPPKTLGVLDQGALWANLGVSLLGFSGALLLLDPLGGAPLSVPAALTAAVVGSLIGTAMVGLAAIPGTQTGRPAMVLLRGLFGARLSYVPTVLNIIQMVGWGAFELWVISMGATAVFGPAVPYAVWVIAAGVLTTSLSIWPLGSVRLLRRYVTLAVIFALIWFAVDFLGHARPAAGGSWQAFAPAVDYVIALSVSWVPMAADFARHSRSSAAAFTGIVGGYTLAQVACLGLGVYAVAITGAAAAGADSTAVFGAFVAAPLGALFFAVLVLRETDQSFANVYSTTVSLQNLMPRVDRRVFSVAIGVVTVGIALLVDVNSYGAFLGVIGAVFVPMFAVLAVDYFLLGGAARWNTDEDAPARWSMLVPWALGFAAYWLTTSTPTIAAWDGFWAAAREAIGFTRQPWMNGALGAALVAALVTLAVGLVTRRGDRSPALRSGTRR
ncbi:putative hydroxymethylpyrimidine transporter CytX [Nonomuraea roseoviolacea subsp. roseoviolacea]|uniref:Hydroxymethylpyrimidine transporter CytX n=1 Tax=Nonomuraea roseoviolacea subsp. carminata TaxID=160689 RepID=A0ABT1JZM5_9ACTN|nr:cytosine permease [Nonomuraea roseoviolacea]MCP2347206.1 putative hydroxymethylpyrimidine transporter CytX [Nonomuraea roseoviolacea subsp. carminata]